MPKTNHTIRNMISTVKHLDSINPDANKPAHTEKQYPQSNNLCSHSNIFTFLPILNINALKGVNISDLVTTSVTASVKITDNIINVSNSILIFSCVYKLFALYFSQINCRALILVSFTVVAFNTTRYTIVNI